MTGIVFQKIHAVHDRDHRIQTRNIREAKSFSIAKLEGRCNRQRFRHTGAFDQQVVKAPFVGQSAYLLQQVIAQGATNAAICHFHQLFLGMAQIGPTIADQIRVNVHFGHVIHNDRDAASGTVVEHCIQERGLPRAKKP